MADDPNRDYLTVEAAAREAGISPTRIWALIRDAGLTRYHIPGEHKRTFIHRRDLAKLKKPIPVKAARAKPAPAKE